MAIARMKLISIIGLLTELDTVINICGSSGVFQPDNVYSFYSNTENFSAIVNDNKPENLMKNLEAAVNNFGKKLFKIDIRNFESDEKDIENYVNNFCNNLNAISEQKKALRQQLDKVTTNLQLLSHFKTLDCDINDMLACKYVKFRFGRLPIENYKQLQSRYNNEELIFYPCSTDKTYCWGIYFSTIDNFEDIDRIFSKLFFTKYDMEEFSGNIVQNISELEREKNEIINKIREIDKKVTKIWDVQEKQCMRFYSLLDKLNTYNKIKKFVAKYNNSFILVGWIPADEEKVFCRQLKRIKGIEFSCEDYNNLDISHNPPVKLKNNRMFKPFEFFVDTYGLPSYNEIDPTVFVAITYTILFGIMFADFGQGIVLSIAGYFMWKLKKMRLGKICIQCGVSSAFFGIVFGSVFGFEHLLDPLYEKIFGLHQKPIEVMSSESTNGIIYSAIGIGIFLLILAMILNIFSLFKQRKYGEVIFSHNGICGLLFYVAMVFLIINMAILKINIPLGIFAIFFLVVPIFLIMFKDIFIGLFDGKSDWKPQSWGDYIAQSFFELFEILLSYVTNTMSFLRVGSFVLVHAGMMLVVFTIAEMSGGMGYVITLVVGNIFVMCFEALLAGIQVLRLEFYELFSRFFEGQGKSFAPITINND